MTTNYGFVFALNIKDGAVLWQRDMAMPIVSPPAIGNNRVVFTTINNRTFALKTNDGAVEWSHTGMVEATRIAQKVSPVIYKHLVIVSYASGELIAFNLHNGSRAWDTTLIDSHYRHTVTPLSGIQSTPILENGVLFVTSSEGVLYAFEAASGRQLWNKDIYARGSVWAAGNVVLCDNEQ